ncbi:hypothetical protein BaRGS_00001314 [Batillaria attramentaria]|uniref:Uncharacterized protein n=1 Tax=Batillaria attramentaria TaxID=370345 RepID=A0ABD0M5Z9_9CAEN
MELLSPSRLRLARQTRFPVVGRLLGVSEFRPHPFLRRAGGRRGGAASSKLLPQQAFLASAHSLAKQSPPRKLSGD